MAVAKLQHTGYLKPSSKLREGLKKNYDEGKENLKDKYEEGKENLMEKYDDTKEDFIDMYQDQEYCTCSHHGTWCQNDPDT